MIKRGGLCATEAALELHMQHGAEAARAGALWEGDVLSRKRDNARPGAAKGKEAARLLAKARSASFCRFLFRFLHCGVQVLLQLLLRFEINELFDLRNFQRFVGLL